jgi:hypothetical protein
LGSVILFIYKRYITILFIFVKQIYTLFL